MILDESRAKLGRAYQHFKSLEDQITSFLEAKPYRVAIENPSDGRYVFRLDNAPEIPAKEWALMVGDCVHNLRSSLDYIAWRLAGSDPGDTQTQFPIFTSKAGWDSHSQRRVGRMLPSAQTHLQRNQPYHLPEPDESPLNVLRVLDDTDKHKLLTVVAAVPLTFGVEWATTVDPKVSEPIAHIATNAELVGDVVIAFIDDPNSAPDVKMKVDFTPEIAFGDGVLSRRHAVIPNLMALVGMVELINRDFESNPDLFRRT